MLNHHNATVNCVQFTNNCSHLISGSSDGELAIVRVGSWQLEKIWGKAHKGSAVLDIAVHSSGKLALTIGSDCSLRTWNLVKGRQAYVINLNSKSKDARSLDKIVWADDGIRFILSGGKYTEIWNIETGGILKVIEHNEKVCSCIWVSENQIVVGYEDGQMALVEINECTKNTQKAHNGRVKALVKHSKWIISASSTGEIKVWNSELQELSKYDTGCRITCLTVAASTVKIKQEEQDGEILEEVEEETKAKSLKKSSVIVEVEDSDNEDALYKPKMKGKSDNTKLNKIKNYNTNEIKENKIKKNQKRKLDKNQEGESEQLISEIKLKKNKKIAFIEDSDKVNKKRTDIVSENENRSECVKDKLRRDNNVNLKKSFGRKKTNKNNSKKKSKQKI